MTSTERKSFERVRAWRDSGLSAEYFSTGQGFAASSLRQWSSVLRRRGLTAPATGTSLIRLARVERSSPASASAPLTVELGGSRVSIPSGSDAVTVRAVLEALCAGVAGAMR